MRQPSGSGKLPPSLAGATLIFGRLLVAVPSLALARMSQLALDELAVLELVLDGVTVISAWLLHELLEVVGVALSLARMVGRRDHVGVGRCWSFFFLFLYPKEGPSSWSSRLALPLGRPSMKAPPTASSPKVWFVAMSWSLWVVCSFRQPSLSMRDLQVVPKRNVLTMSASTTLGRELHCLENRRI
jgi:hypothetical protein